MFLDARKAEQGSSVSTAVCIIGGGVAGITLALELEKRGIDSILLESGGFKPDSGTIDLYRGENVGIPYEFGDGFRSRFLGGGSNCWGGWCRPLDTHDLEARDWVSGSGWPFDRETLTPYYERAHPVLKLGPQNFDIDHWVPAIGRKDVRAMPLPTGEVQHGVSQFSPPMRFGKHYRNALKNSKRIQAFLYANVVDIETDESGQSVSNVHVQTLTGIRFKVSGRYTVLAAGGIENARILLSANKNHKNGLGNANDLVGRYFMEHPRLLLGKIKFHEKWRRNKLYDSKFHYLNKSVAANGTMIGAQLSIAPHVQERESLLNAKIWFQSTFPGEGTPAAEAIVRMKHRLHAKVDPHHNVFSDLVTMARQPLDSANFIIARQFQPVGFMKEMHFQMIKEAQFQMICEPTLNRDSRVMLSDNRDLLGMRRVRVDWRLEDQVKHTFDRSLQIIADELRQTGVAEVELDAPLLGREWPASLEGTWHHMGTTRMSDSPKQGVVDQHQCIHGMSNMYVAGSSVFPTAGANFPTITIVAMSLRLADHLVSKLGSAGGVAMTPRVSFAENAAA